MCRGQLLLLLVFCIRNSSCVIDAVYDAGKEVWKLYSMMDNIKLNTTDDIRGISELFTGTYVPNQMIRIQIDEIHEQLNRLEASINPKIIRDSLELSSSDIMLYKCMDTFDLFISSIDEYYEQFRISINGGSYHSNHLLQDFTRLILNVEANIEVMRKIVTEAGELLPNHKNLIYAVTGHTLSLSTQICDGPRITTDLLVHLFNIVMIAEIKGQVMIASLSIHRNVENEGWKYMNSQIKERFVKQFKIYVDLFKENIETTENTYLRACDPVNGTWIRGQSFYELEGTSQATIFRYHWAMCKHSSCNNVWYEKSRQCLSEYYDKRSGCSNSPTQCAYLSSIQACVLKSGPYKFQYVNSTELGFLGQNSECPKDNGYIIEDGKGWDSIHAACVCNCYGIHNRISLAVIESNVRVNRVITGIRFFYKDHILHIQPKEGKLNADGYISPYSERWIPIPKNITASQIQPINRKNRVFFFDNVRLPSGFVLTGVKFNEVKRGTVTGFGIEIFGAPFNYRSGEIKRDRKFRMSKRASNDESQQRLSFTAVSSLYTTLPHKLSPTTSTYVSLERSNLHEDFGQSTLPLFDAVAIKSTPPAAMSGIGIFHKGVEGYAGLISLKVYGIKYAKYFNDFKLIHMTSGREFFNV